MLQSGKASILTILALAAVLIIVGLLAFSRESIGSVGTRFMDALKAGDVATLTKMSYLGNVTEEEMAKKWDFAVNTAAPYYRFEYRVVSAKETTDKSGSVRLQVNRNIDHGGSYEEAFELPMVKVGDEWKVNVHAISREMYPALP